MIALDIFIRITISVEPPSLTKNSIFGVKKFHLQFKHQLPTWLFTELFGSLWLSWNTTFFIVIPHNTIIFCSVKHDSSHVKNKKHIRI